MTHDADLADDVRRLTQPYTVTVETSRWTPSRNRVWTTRRVTHPALLDQITDAAALRGGRHEGVIGRHALDGTVPAGVALLDAIRRRTTRWLHHLSAHPTSDLKADLRTLADLADTLDRDTLTRLAADIDRFRRSAEQFIRW